MKYVTGIFIEIALNLQIALGGMDIPMMLILVIHEHDICFHLFVSFLIPSVNTQNSVMFAFSWITFLDD